MHLIFTEEQQRFRQEVRDFCEKTPWGELTSMRYATRDYSPTFYREVAKKGWLGLAIPVEYGGLGRDAIDWTIFTEEMGYYRAPIGLAAFAGVINIMSRILLSHGTEDQKKDYLSRIARGEIWVGQCFTEPNAGTDLAAVETRAVLDGDHYVVNGSKMFWTDAHYGQEYMQIDDYTLLMARTDPDAPPKKGISLFILDPNAPGITVTPVLTMGGIRTNSGFLEDVRIPRENLIGEENRGWDYFVEVLPFYWQRVQGGLVGDAQWMFDEIVRYAKTTKRGGVLLSQDPLIRRKIADAAIDLSVLRLQIYRMAWMMDEDMDVFNLSATLRVFSDEAMIRLTKATMDILELHSQIQTGSEYAPVRGPIEERYRTNVIRLFGNCGLFAGKNYVARDVLGLPES